MTNEDAILTDFLKSIGPWRQHVIVGGGYAPLIYKLYLSDTTSPPPVGTRDIDSLIPRRLEKVAGKSLAQHLSHAGFIPFYKDYDIPATEAWIKEISGTEIEVEFLTDTATRGDKAKNVKIAGIVAQPLSYLSLSLNRMLRFKTDGGESGLTRARVTQWCQLKGRV
jgi:Nucleotidyltransferase